MKTCIRWAGSKKSLLPTLRQYWLSTYRRYIEPFCGSACLFFAIEPENAILSDINYELITTFTVLKSDPAAVIAGLERLRINKSTYYSLRERDPCGLSEINLAVRFLFLNKLCFNGIYRTNSFGKFNVPYAEPKSTPRFDFESIVQMSALLRKASLMHVDFANALDKATRDDFVYLDPPYAVARRRVFSDYHPRSFSADDLCRLGDALLSLDRRGSKFLLSYADSAEGRALVKSWNWRRIRTRRHVAGFAAHRKHSYELIASNEELLHVG